MLLRGCWFPLANAPIYARGVTTGRLLCELLNMSTHNVYSCIAVLVHHRSSA